MEESELAELKNIIRHNLSVDMSLDCTGPSPRTRRRLQHMSCIKLGRAKSSLYEIVLSHAFQAEKMCPTAGVRLLKEFVGLNSTDDTVSLRDKKDVHALLKRNFKSDKVSSLLSTVIDHASLSTKISIKKSTGAQTYIDMTDGYVFHLRHLLKNTSAILSKCRVVCIDGYVESVSEIHHLLTYLSEVKLPCLMFVRGMSEDVLHTIKVNNDRKTLVVFPYLVPFDPENANTLVDIAVVSGTDVISSLKGETISSITEDNLGSLDGCTLLGDQLSLRTQSTRKRVREHLSHLRRQLEERPELEKILSQRIKSMSSSCIDICIPDDIDYYSMSQQLDEGIRLITSILGKTYDPAGVASKILASLNTALDASSGVCLLSSEKV